MGKGGGMRWTQDALDEYNRRTHRIDVRKGEAAPLPAKPKKPAKYRNEKVEIDGIVFDSKREATHWTRLVQLQQAGQISDLRRQVSYQLIPYQRRGDGKAERACNYVADFVYIEHGKTVVADAKGMKTRDYILKRKLMLYVHGITIKEL